MMKKLCEWLKEAYPLDVPMPVLKAQKCPAFKHANGSWTWDSFERFYAPHKHDIGVLLHDLCVVDVDSHDLVAALEQEFPALKNVPCERTSKGRHYFFERSALADKLGFFDGRSQVRRGIDFKTVCSNGTSGIIIVSPSEHKSWVRSPWEMTCVADAGGKLMPMPDDVLRAVATPTYCEVDAELAFSDGSTLAVRNSTSLAKWAFTSAFCGADALFTDVERIVMPPECDVASVRYVHDICESGRSDMLPPDGQKIARVADMLGVPNLRALFSMHVPYSHLRVALDLQEINPAWAQCFVRRSDSMVRLSDDATIVYSPLHTHDERWLLHSKLPLRNRTLPGQALLAKDLSALPDWIEALLLSHGNLALAGGAALSLACPDIEFGDYDLFLYGATEEQANAILTELTEHALIETWSQTGNAVTCFVKDDQTHPVQLVLRLHDTLEDVLSSFDLAPSKIAITKNAQGTLDVFVTESWIEAITRMAFWVDTDCWSAASTSRIFKYYIKGFDVFVPGLRRKALKHAVRMHARAPNGGIGSLFHVEWHVRHKSKHPDAALIRFCVSEYNYWGERFQSGYAERASWGARLYYIVRSGLAWFGVRPSKRDIRKFFPVQWQKDRLCHLRPAQHSEAFDMESYGHNS